MSFLSFPTPQKENTIHKMSPTAPVTRLHNDILKIHTLTLMSLTCRGNVRIISYSHADRLHPFYLIFVSYTVNLWLRSRCSRSATHSHRGRGRRRTGEDRERLRKNGCKGGIQFREGVSTGVFRQRAELFSFHRINFVWIRFNEMFWTTDFPLQR